MNFVDKNQDGNISTAEFVELFKLFGNYSLEEQLPNENPRNDIYTIIEKSYDINIDFEKELGKIDHYEDGGIEVPHFTNLLMNLPFGLTSAEIDMYQQSSIDYTNIGKINYVKLINTEKFKRIKYMWNIKNTN